MTPQLLPLSEIATEAAKMALIERKNMKVELKGDRSLVTNADKAIELFLRRELAAAYPGTTFWGEEFGHEPEGPEGIWLLDPIDGTSNFVYGCPYWGISIALIQKGKILMGAIPLPDLEETYLCQAGSGVTVNGEPLPMIPPGPILPYELVSLSNSDVVAASLKGIVAKRRETGAFVIDGTFFASQRHRAMVGGNERLYDAAASILFALELGGEVGFLDRSSFDIDALTRPIPLKPWAMVPAGSGVFS